MPATLNLKTESRWTLPPGMFRILLAYVVVVTHSLPLKLGPAAVFLFFMLSGYWIHVMWQREYTQTYAPWRVFVISRLWRLLPVYLPCVALYFIVLRLTSHPVSPLLTSPIQALHFYFSNIFILGLVQLPPAYRVDYPAWSLDIEMQYYLIAPLIIGLVASRKSPAWMLALVAVAAVFTGYYLVYYEGNQAFSGIMPMYLLFFLIGLCSARYNWRPSARLSNASLMAGAVLVVAVIAFHKTRPLFLMGPFMGPISFYSPAANLLLAAVLAPYAMATVRVNAKTRGRFFAAFDRHFSNLTYEVYLLHASFLTGFGYLLLGLKKWQQVCFMPVTYLAVFALACLVYHYYDQPIDNKRRNYVRRASLPLPASPQSHPNPAGQAGLTGSAASPMPQRGRGSSPTSAPAHFGS